MKRLLHANNQHGFALIAVLLILALVTLIGIAATDTSTLELRIAGNDRVSKIDFYNQELSLAAGNLNYRDWLTTTYLTTDEDSAYFPTPGTDDDDDGITDLSEITVDGEVVGSYRVKNIVANDSGIEDWDPDIDDWEDLDMFGDDAEKHPANDVPILSHTDKPAPGSGYDPTNFEIRRYAITAYSTDDEDKGKVILQEGVYKVFNKYN